MCKYVLYIYLDKLFTLSNKPLRKLQNKPLTTPVYELYREYNIFPVAELLFFSCFYWYMNFCIIKIEFFVANCISET
jgi:hypothetical protein